LTTHRTQKTNFFFDQRLFGPAGSSSSRGPFLACSNFSAVLFFGPCYVSVKFPVVFLLFFLMTIVSALAPFWALCFVPFVLYFLLRCHHQVNLLQDFSPRGKVVLVVCLFFNSETPPSSKEVLCACGFFPFRPSFFVWRSFPCHAFSFEF